MPLGAGRLAFLAKSGTVAAAATVVRKKSGVEAVNDTQVDTDQYIYGRSSILFDGTNDELQTKTKIDFSNPWCVECWFRTGSSATQNMIVKSSSAEDTEGDLGFNFRLASGKLQVFLSSDGSNWNIASPMNGSTSYSTNTWHHMALNWDGSNYRIWLDGNLENTTVSSTQVHQGSFDEIYIGGAVGSTAHFSGHLSEIRFSSAARYVKTGSQPNGPFTNDADTTLLIHGNGLDTLNHFNDDNGDKQANFRTDAYASSLKLAVPFDSENGINDVAHQITGTGLSSAASEQGSAAVSTNTAGPYYPSYNNAQNNSQGGIALVYTMPATMPSSVSGTFVVEAWVRATDGTSNNNWTLSSADQNGRWLFGFNTTSSQGFGGENNIGLSDTNWHHIAIVCDSGTHAIYKDGLYLGSWGSANTGFTELHVGQFNNTDTNDFRGQIQDLKVYHGTNKGYTGTNSGTANFEVPKSIIEHSGKHVAVVPQGSVQLSEQQYKYNGSSARFQGDGGITLVPQHPDDFIFYEGEPFTFECFLYADNDSGSASSGILANKADTGGNSNEDFFLLWRNHDRKIQVFTTDLNVAVASSALSLNAWHHIALVRDSSDNMALFVNGSRTQSTSSATTKIGKPTRCNIGIGSMADGSGISFNNTSSGSKNGYIDQVRISKTNRYDPTSSTLTVPATNFTPDSDDVAIFDFYGVSGSKYIESFNGKTSSFEGANPSVRFGGQISNTHYKFGGTSYYQTSEYDGIKMPVEDPFDSIGTSEFTFEGWFRIATSVTGDTFLFNGNNQFALAYNDTDNRLEYRADGDTTTRITGSTSMNINQWYHVAISRDSSGNTRMFLDGNQEGSTYADDRNWSNNNEYLFGVFRSGDKAFRGYYDEIRVSNTARYTANFTPPTEQFQNDSNTLLLLHFDGTDGDTVGNAIRNDEGTHS